MTAESGMSRRAHARESWGCFLTVSSAWPWPCPSCAISFACDARKKIGYESWLSLGRLEQFPSGQTRLATYKIPWSMPGTAKPATSHAGFGMLTIRTFQVFAINCAHLGCPVRWFPQSNLFMCPCHGGAYYQDGSRASGPPERGLFQYHYKIEDGKLLIKAGEMPTPGQPVANKAGGRRHAPDQKLGEWFDLRLQLGKPIRETPNTRFRARPRAGSMFSAAPRSRVSCSRLSPAFCLR
jgi:nitrite reductase/ring-hydroxylating ferredoxin subunit